MLELQLVHTQVDTGPAGELSRDGMVEAVRDSSQKYSSGHHRPSRSTDGDYAMTD